MRSPARPGTAARAAETASTAAGLAADFDILPLPAGRLDGGDVLRIGATLYVGRSTRSDAAGIAALRRLAAPLGFTVIEVAVGGCLHLKTAATWLGPDGAGIGTLLVNPAWIDMRAFGPRACLAVDPAEPWAANALRIGPHLLVAGGAPRTAALLAARGFALTQVDISELQKAEAGLTCLSLIG